MFTNFPNRPTYGVFTGEVIFFLLFSKYFDFDITVSVIFYFIYLFIHTHGILQTYIQLDTTKMFAYIHVKS